MSELRQDGMTGAWVVIAPERGGRPQPPTPASLTTRPARQFDPSCPFCPGNEEHLARIIEESPCCEPPGWRTRVVPNKFPAVRPDVRQQPMAGRMRPGIAAHGFHEVIVEASRHDADFTAFSEEQLAAVIQIYRRRYIELAAQPAIKSVLVFRNHGARSGASLLHPHSQVIATDMTLPRSAATAAWTESRYARGGRCPVCAENESELADGQRVVEQTAHFLAIVPFAATGPCEQRILPRKHQASFAQCDDGELVDFGRLLQRSLRRLRNVLVDPPYNFVFECGAAKMAADGCAHWWLRIVPDVVTPGGFELGAGMPINPSWPEDDAAALRAVAATPQDDGS